MYVDSHGHSPYFTLSMNYKKLIEFFAYKCIAIMVLVTYNGEKFLRIMNVIFEGVVSLPRSIPYMTKQKSIDFSGNTISLL